MFSIYRRLLYETMTMTMDEDDNNSANGNLSNSSINQQSMICSPPDLNSSASSGPSSPNPTGEIRWAFSQVKGTIDDEVADGNRFQFVPSEN